MDHEKAEVKEAVYVNEEENDSEAPATGFLRWVWIAVALFSGVYIFIPEPTDALPIFGWLDEGLAVVLLTTSLAKLGIRIPILDRFLSRRSKKKSSKK